MRVVFIAGNPMPTQKAHGVHVAKQCEAFAAAGADAELWFPAPRGQPPPTPREVFDFYGIRDGSFAVRSFAVPPVMRLERPLGRLFPYLFVLYSHLVALRVMALARRDRADLYFTTDVDVAFWLTLINAPIMWECHRVPHRVGRVELRRVFASRSLCGVVALTAITREELAELGMPTDRALVVGEGVDLPVYDRLPSRHRCREVLGLPRDRPIVAYVGRFRTLDQEKGIPELVRAMAEVPAIDGREPLLVCVGGPMDCVPAYRAEAADAGTPDDRLQFVDRVSSSEVPYWIGAADVAVMPFPAHEHYTRYTSPMKMFEYMAAGTAIVATDLPTVREVLEHDRNAWLVPPDDVSALGNGIGEVLLDPELAHRLAEQARRDVEPHDWTARARHLLEFATAGIR
jgi:glycosyltransferase involved in cell wall biosynthesis